MVYKYQCFNVRFKENVQFTAKEFCKLNKEHFVLMNFLDKNERDVKINYSLMRLGFDIKQREFLSKDSKYTTNRLTIVPKSNVEYSAYVRYSCDKCGNILHTEYIFVFTDYPTIYIHMNQERFDSLFEIINERTFSAKDCTFFNFLENNLYEYARSDY